MKITNVETLNYYDGITEFLGMIEVEETYEGKTYPVRRFVYGAQTIESSSLDTYVYDCWTLPPKATEAGDYIGGFAKPEFQANEDDLELKSVP